ncbi:MAG TPA: hypothetical protein VET65_09770, partial [Candidatus Limnocylindrales bacterium]|nr:hypothetical protein [Candidatus Limnocylindrales bacterium]
MMMSTGLTFGSISALFGLTHGYIDQRQYSILVTVVVMTALIPTLVAQAAFHPTTHALQYGAEEEPLGADVPDEETA